MKKPNLFVRAFCCFFAYYMAMPMSMWAQFLINPPTFPDTNTVRVTLSGTESTNAHIIFFTPNLATNTALWTRAVTGTVGQTTFDLTKPTSANGFFRAGIAPVETPTVATPVLTPGSGSYIGPTNITITCATEGAAIYYTTNGDIPTGLDNYIYDGGTVTLSSSVTLKAKAFKNGYFDSAVATATYTINAGPSVYAGPQQIITTSSTTLQGIVTDDGLIGGGTRFTNWSKISGPGTVTFGNANLTNSTATFGTDGIYVLQLRASDGQFTNSDMVTIAVNPTLSVTLTAPADGSTYTVPTNFLLQATAACTSGSVTQLLFYSDATLIGISSNAPFSLDWKSVPAGSHVLTAVAVSDDVNNYSLASDPVNITVNWPTNVGQVTLSLTDLQLPVAGLPIAINRLYDTRRENAGAFGEKWRLDWEDPKIEASSMTGGWEGYSSIQYCVRPTSDHLITVSLGESEKYYFSARVVFNSTANQCINAMNPMGYYNIFVHLVFDSLGQGQLSMSSPSNLGLTPTGYDPGDGCLGTWFGPLKLATFEEDDFEICGAYATDWEPALSGFTFTAPDGTQYGFNNDGSLAWKKDRNGNTLTYDYSGITWSNPSLGSSKQATFTRDGNNRITEIYDPIAINTSGSPVLKYDYDGNGNLTNAARLIQRSPAVYENTLYAYTNASYSHHLTSITDPRPVTTARYEYDSSGRLSKQFDALNRYTSYTYDLVNRRHVITDRLTNSTIQNFTEAGQVSSVQDAIGAVTSFTYDERGRKTSEVNPLGQTTTYAYDSSDNLTEVTNEIGSATSTTYNEFGQPLVAVDARGFGTTNVYDSNGNLMFVTNSFGVVSAYGYDLLGNRTAETNALGRPEQVILLNAYNEFGWLTNSATLNAAFSTLGSVDYIYDDDGNRITEIKTRTLPNSSTETLTNQWVFDAANRLMAAIDPIGGTNRIFYSATGQQSQTVDASGRTNSYYYDLIGLLTNTTYADGLSEKFFFDAEGRRTQSVDRGGRTSIYSYNALGRLTRTTYPDGTYSQSYFDLAGRLRRVAQGTPPPGSFLPNTEIVTAYYYFDAAGQQVAITNALDDGTRFAYDANGNKTNSVDALGRTTTFVYDGLNQQTKVIFPDNTSESYGYDGLGRRVAVTNQAGVVTRFGFDALNRLVSVTNAFGTSQQMVTRHVYDEVGNLLQQVDGLNRTNKFEYDKLGRRSKETMPGNQVATFGYDAVGNLIRQTNFNSVIITNQYDALNRLTNRASVNGYKITFAYSPTGQRTNMVDASGTNTYVYDSRDRLATNATPQGTLVYTYDEFGNLATIQSTTANGVNLNYHYDVLNRLTNVLDLATGTTNTYVLDAVGNLQTVRYHNSVTNRYTYDALNRLTNLVAGTPSASLASFAYKLASAGNRTNLAETVNGTGRTNQWSYDPLYRLTNEVLIAASGGTISYKYDGIGNRTNRTSTVGGIANQNFTYNSNDQLSSDVYDSNGNTRTNGSNAFFYDAENRLTNAIVGGISITIVYDGDGNRVRKIVGATTNTYLVDSRNPSGFAQVLEEKSNGTLAKVYSYGLDLISQRDASSGAVYYFGYDGNGNTRFLTTTNASVANVFAYDAFGTLVASNAAPQTDYLFAGEQRDANLGFIYLRARYLNAGTGRFWSRDSFEGQLADPLSLHRYLYAANEPIDRVDPSGHEYTVAASLTVLSIYTTFAQISTSGAAASKAKQQAQSPLPALPTDPNEQLLVGLIFAESSTAGTGGENEDEKIEIGLTVLNRTYYAKLSRWNSGFGDGTVAGAIKKPGEFVSYGGSRWKLVMSGDRLKTKAQLEQLKSGERTHLILSLDSAKFANNGSAPLPTGLAGIGNPPGQFPIAFNQAQNIPPNRDRMFRFLRVGSHTFYAFKPGRELQ